MFYKSVKDYIVLGRKFRSEDCLKEDIGKVRLEITEALDSDLNISAALAAFFTFWWSIESKVKGVVISENDRQQLLRFLGEFVNGILGITLDKPIPEHIKEKVELRNRLRKEKKFGEADEIRKKIEVEGYKLWDEPGGTGVARV